MTLYVLLPLLLTLGIAFVTQWSIGASGARSLGRAAVAAGAVQVLLVSLMLALALLALARPPEERCPLSELEWLGAIALLFATAIVGGFLLATVIADARRQRGALVWHVLAVPAAIVLPYVAGFAYLYWGLSCTS